VRGRERIGVNWRDEARESRSWNGCPSPTNFYISSHSRVQTNKKSISQMELGSVIQFITCVRHSNTRRRDLILAKKAETFWNIHLLVCSFESNNWLIWPSAEREDNRPGNSLCLLGKNSVISLTHAKDPMKREREGEREYRESSASWSSRLDALCWHADREVSSERVVWK